LLILADTKISALPAATLPLAGTEVLPIVQGGTTDQVSVANLTAGRAISATQLTLTTGNVIVSDGKGIDFSATPGTGTSELFSDYEEGTWTPTIVGTTTAGSATYSVQVGRYTKIGNRVNFQASLAWTAHTGTGNMRVSGLPFTSSATSSNTSTVSIYHNNMVMTLSNVAQTYIPTSSTQVVLDQVPVGGGTSSPVPLDIDVSYFIVSGQYQT
jgi:hypothetical protein